MTTLPNDVISSVCENLSNMDLHSKSADEMWKSFNKQRKEGLFCDAIIQCGQQSFPVHRCILVSVSKYFKVLFSASPDTSKQSTSFKSFNEETVALLLDILYHDVNVDTMNIGELLRLAEFIQSKWLVDVLVQVIRTKINKDTVHNFYAIGSEAGTKKLISLTYSYIKRYCQDSCLWKDNPVHKCFYDKRVTLMRAQDDQYWLMDWEKKTCEPYDGRCKQGGGLVSNVSLGDTIITIHLIYIYKDNVFVVTEQSLGYLDRIVIKQYSYCSQIYGNVIADLNLQQGITPNIMENHGGSVAVRQVLYDGEHSLYFLFDNATTALIKKFNLKTNRFLSNFILLPMNDSNYCATLHDCKQLGKLVILEIDTIYKIDDFHFDHVFGTHDLEKIEISPCVKTKKSDKKLNCYHIDSMKVCNGVLYSFVPSEDKSIFSVLYLNAVKYEWILLCNFRMYSETICPFVAMSKLYLMLENCCIHVENIVKIYAEEDEEESIVVDSCWEYHGDYMFSFDPDVKILKKCNIKLPQIYWDQPFDDLPEHIFL